MLPTPTLFCLCERVIVSDDDTVSVITIMERLTIETIATDVSHVAPVSWSIFTFWSREDGSTVEHFEQRVEGFAAKENATPFFQAVVPITFEQGFVIAKIKHVNYGMPVSNSGRMRFVLSVRTVGELEWHECSTFPVEIIFNVRSPES